jgi:hypothetical protein
MTHLVFTSDSTPFGLLIRAGSFSAASHVAIGLGDENGPLLHAYEPGVILEPRERWFGAPNNQRFIAEYKILPDVSEGLRECFTQIGKPYDGVGALKIAVLRGLQLFGSPIQSLGPDSKTAFTCAHFVMLLDPLGRRIPEWRLLNRETLAPGDVLRVADGPSFRRVR